MVLVCIKLTFRVKVFIITPDKSIIFKTKRRKSTTYLANLIGSVDDAFIEPKVLSNTPYQATTGLALVPGDQVSGSIHIRGYGFLAEYMFTGLDRFSNDDWLDRVGEADDDGVYVGSSQ